MSSSLDTWAIPGLTMSFFLPLNSREKLNQGPSSTLNIINVPKYSINETFTASPNTFTEVSLRVLLTSFY